MFLLLRFELLEDDEEDEDYDFLPLDEWWWLSFLRSLCLLFELFEEEELEEEDDLDFLSFLLPFRDGLDLDLCTTRTGASVWI